MVLLWMGCLAVAFLLKYHCIHELCLHLIIGLFSVVYPCQKWYHLACFLHYIFIHSYLIFANLVDVSFSDANSGKQTLLAGIYLKWEFKSDWVIRNNIDDVCIIQPIRTIQTDRQERACSKTKMVLLERKLTYKKETWNTYILRNLVGTVNQAVHMITNIYIQKQINLQTIDFNIWKQIYYMKHMSYTFRRSVFLHFNSNNAINGIKLMQFLLCSKLLTFIPNASLIGA